MNNEKNKNNDKNSISPIINEKDITNKKENSSFFDSSNSYSKKSQNSLSKRKKGKRLTIEIKKNTINRDLKSHHSYLKYFADKLFCNEEHLNKNNLLYKKKSSSNQNLNHFLQIGKKKLQLIENKIKISDKNTNTKKNKNFCPTFFKLELKEKNPKKQTIFNIIKALHRKNNDSPNNSNNNSSLTNHNVNNIFNKCQTLKINEKIKNIEEKGKEEIEEKKEDIITKKEIIGERENEINIFKEKQIQKKENKRKINCYPLKSLCCLCYK